MAVSDLNIERGAVKDVEFTLYEDSAQTQLTDLTGKRAVLQLVGRGVSYLKVDSAVDTAAISVDVVTATISVHLTRQHTQRLLTSCNYELVTVDVADPDEVESIATGDVHVTQMLVDLD